MKQEKRAQTGRSSRRLKNLPLTHSHVRFNDNGLSIATYTINGHACDIDPQTGKILTNTSIQ